MLSDAAHPDYDVSLVQMVPTLVHRAKTTLPDAFRTGLGEPYEDEDISVAIDRAHEKHIRDCVLPVVVPKLPRSVVDGLGRGFRVAELGCGGGNMLAAFARAFPKSSFVGYEVSAAALAVARRNLAASALGNASVVDANARPLGSAAGSFDLVTTLDVLHDAPNPKELIAQVRDALKPGGVWLLADIAGLEGTRRNVTHNPAAATMYAFSTTLCMCCALSTPDGEGLGTLGFPPSVARKMLVDGAGFDDVAVLHEADNTRWFRVTKKA